MRAGRVFGAALALALFAGAGIAQGPPATPEATQTQSQPQAAVLVLDVEQAYVTSAWGQRAGRDLETA
ncbi:MAG: hypothetical protein Q4G26_15125, partial [Paracoccus sp. (in: a-proteobacteria)]|nr:hypothetical protein [Paracoccus sp. (in: a-proteobacteria)]